jgi:hypothetical protein
VIGVANGDIGLHERPPPRLVNLESHSTRDDLLDEHGAIERELEVFRNEMANTDARGLVAPFARFEHRLRGHLQYEEEELIPRFAQEHPREAEELLAEHALLRQRLDDLAIAVELHSATASDVEAVLETLATHGRHEEHLFYQWAYR